MLGPEAVFISREAYRPIKTDNNPPITDSITICLGLFDKLRAIAVGIINNPVISNTPTIFIEMAISAASRIVNIAFTLSGLMPSASASSKFTVEANRGFQIYHKTNSISPPPIQTASMSFVFTDSISPNKTPIISNLINDKKPSITNPIAKEEWDINPSKESPAKLVVFCNLSKSKATREETAKIVIETLILKVIESKTPNKAEWANVSPKNDNRLQTTKHPNGPATKAIPMPAISALTKKSSNIFI